MKIGFNLLLWTGHMTEAHLPVAKQLKDTGYDGVEIPVLDASSVAHYRGLGDRLNSEGLARTAVALLPDEAHSAISSDPAARRGAVDHLTRVIDCAHALGAEVLCGPYYQPLGVFSGGKPTVEELAWAADVHREIAPLARAAGMTCALEPLNRFEAYLLNTVEQSIDYVDRVAAPGFGILYDTFHANIEEKDPLAAATAAFRSGHLAHVHISENDRGTPGRGHAPLRETIRLLKELGYDGWLTIEAFGRAVPEIAAATRVWRDFFPDPEQVYTEGFQLIRDALA